MTKNPVASCILKTVKKNKALTFLVLVAVVCSVVFAVLPPLVLENAVNNLTAKKQVGISIALAYFSLIALSGISDSVRGVFITKLGQRITSGLRNEMCEKLTKLPASYFVSNETGKTVSRFINDVDTIETLFKSGIIGMIVDLFKIITILFVIFTKSLGLGLIMLVVSPIIFCISNYFKKRMRAAQLDKRRAIAKINNHVPETLANLRTVRTLEKKDYMEIVFSRYVDESYKAAEKTNFYEAIYTPIISEANTLVIAVVMTLSALGGNMQSFFGMTVGTAVAVISYINKIFNPIENLGMEIQNIQSAVAGIKRVNDLLRENEKSEQSILSLDELDYTKPAVEFDNVVFGYTDRIVLNKINFTVNNGENIAFTGRTGAGKSTVYRLILGYFQPNEGSVKIFGKDASKISDSVKRKLFGYIEQTVKTVKGTVKDQITLGDESVTDEQILSAINIAGLKETIDEMQKGIYTIYDKSLFSQGQLQLLSVARAVVFNPMVLLLDEITANLDSDTEKRISEAIKRAKHDRTVINISHRLGDITEINRIIEIK